MEEVHALAGDKQRLEAEIIMTLKYNPHDAQFWEIASMTPPEAFTDDGCRKTFEIMHRLKKEGRTWKEDDFAAFSTPSGMMVIPSSLDLSENVTRLNLNYKKAERTRWLEGALSKTDNDKLWESYLSTPPKTQTNHFQFTTWEDTAKILPDISWLWNRWLPNGMASMVIGAVEIGKSAYCLGLARSAILGTAWPTGDIPPSGGRVVWVDTENAMAINLERAKHFGIPMNAIINPAANPLDDLDLMSPEGWDRFEAAMHLDEVRLAVIDSLGGSYMRENDPKVKVLVKKISYVAQATGVNIILVHHPRKLHLGENDVISLDRVRGHSGIVQFPRTILAIEKPDPILDTARVKVIKSNLGKKPEPVGFEWQDNQITYVDAPEETKPYTALDGAVDFLEANLQHEPKLAKDIMEEATQAGIAPATLQRAKKKLGILSKKEATGWHWGRTYLGGMPVETNEIQ